MVLWLQNSPEKSMDKYFYYDNHTSEPDSNYIFYLFFELLKKLALIEHPSDIFSLYPLIPLSAIEEPNLDLKNLPEKLQTKISANYEILSGKTNLFITSEEYSKNINIFANCTRGQLNAAIAKKLLNKIAISRIGDTVLPHETIYSVIGRWRANFNQYTEPNQKNILIFIKQMLNNIFGLKNDFGLTGFPIGFPILHISPDGKLSIDIPVRLFELQPYWSEYFSAFQHPFFISAGFDAGWREYGNCITLSNLQNLTTQSSLSELQYNTQNSAINYSVFQNPFVKKTKTSRREREQFDYSKISPKSGRPQLWAVARRSTSGRKQRQREKQQAQSTAHRVAVGVKLKLNSIELKTDIPKMFAKYAKYLNTPADLTNFIDYSTAIDSTSDLSDLVRNYYGRIVFENLSKFNQSGGDIYADSRSRKTGWSGSGQLSEAMRQKCELAGFSFRKINPAYTSKIFCLSWNKSDPRAVAGYVIKIESQQQQLLLKIFDPPKNQFLTAEKLNEYCENNNTKFDQYKFENNRLVPVTNSTVRLARFFEYLIVQKINNNTSGIHYIEIESGKWVRGSVDNKEFFIDRDINAALNLALYNNWLWPIAKQKLFDYRVSKNIKPKKSNQQLDSINKQINEQNERKNESSLYKLELCDYLLISNTNQQSTGPP